eukprot:835645-Pelagomonas_calceolata.AAC.1
MCKSCSVRVTDGADKDFLQAKPGDLCFFKKRNVSIEGVEGKVCYEWDMIAEGAQFMGGHVAVAVAIPSCGIHVSNNQGGAVAMGVKQIFDVILHFNSVGQSFMRAAGWPVGA